MGRYVSEALGLGVVVPDSPTSEGVVYPQQLGSGMGDQYGPPRGSRSCSVSSTASSHGSAATGASAPAAIMHSPSTATSTGAKLGGGGGGGGKHTSIHRTTAASRAREKGLDASRATHAVSSPAKAGMSRSTSFRSPPRAAPTVGGSGSGSGSASGPGIVVRGEGAVDGRSGVRPDVSAGFAAQPLLRRAQSMHVGPSSSTAQQQSALSSAIAAAASEGEESAEVAPPTHTTAHGAQVQGVLVHLDLSWLRELYCMRLNRYSLSKPVAAKFTWLEMESQLYANYDVLAAKSEGLSYQHDATASHAISRKLMVYDPYDRRVAALHFTNLVELGRTTDLFQLAHAAVKAAPKGTCTMRFSIGAEYCSHVCDCVPCMRIMIQSCLDRIRPPPNAIA